MLGFANHLIGIVRGQGLQLEACCARVLCVCVHGIHLARHVHIHATTTRAFGCEHTNMTTDSHLAASYTQFSQGTLEHRARQMRMQLDLGQMLAHQIDFCSCHLVIQRSVRHTASVRLDLIMELIVHAGMDWAFPLVHLSRKIAQLSHGKTGKQAYRQGDRQTDSLCLNLPSCLKTCMCACECVDALVSGMQVCIRIMHEY